MKHCEASGVATVKRAVTAGIVILVLGIVCSLFGVGLFVLSGTLPIAFGITWVIVSTILLLSGLITFLKFYIAESENKKRLRLISFLEELNADVMRLTGEAGLIAEHLKTLSEEDPCFRERFAISFGNTIDSLRDSLERLQLALNSLVVVERLPSADIAFGLKREAMLIQERLSCCSGILELNRQNKEYRNTLRFLRDQQINEDVLRSHKEISERIIELTFSFCKKEKTDSDWKTYDEKRSALQEEFDAKGKQLIDDAANFKDFLKEGANRFLRKITRTYEFLLKMIKDQQRLVSFKKFYPVSKIFIQKIEKLCADFRRTSFLKKSEVWEGESLLPEDESLIPKGQLFDNEMPVLQGDESLNRNDDLFWENFGDLTASLDALLNCFESQPGVVARIRNQRRRSKQAVQVLTDISCLEQVQSVESLIGCFEDFRRNNQIEKRRAREKFEALLPGLILFTEALNDLYHQNAGSDQLQKAQACAREIAECNGIEFPEKIQALNSVSLLFSAMDILAGIAMHFYETIDFCEERELFMQRNYSEIEDTFSDPIVFLLNRQDYEEALLDLKDEMIDECHDAEASLEASKTVSEGDGELIANWNANLSSWDERRRLIPFLEVKVALTDQLISINRHSYRENGTRDPDAVEKGRKVMDAYYRISDLFEKNQPGWSQKVRNNFRASEHTKTKSDLKRFKKVDAYIQAAVEIIEELDELNMLGVGIFDLSLVVEQTVALEENFYTEEDFQKCRAKAATTLKEAQNAVMLLDRLGYSNKIESIRTAAEVLEQVLKDNISLDSPYPKHSTGLSGRKGM